MDKYRQKLGKFGESLAIKFLKAKKYKIIDKNLFFRSGEIDILAKIEKKLVFFEVKTRTTKTFGYPEEAISRKKMTKISQTINNYLIQHPKVKDWQADCLSISINFFQKTAKIYHLKNLDFSDINNPD